MCEEWYRSYNNKPNVNYGYYFANPVRIGPYGPSTLDDVLEAHRSICNQASDLIEQAGGRADNVVESSPSTSTHHSLFPLYKAIIFMIDRCNYDQEFHHHRPRPLHKITQTQSILIVRTGSTESLSAPISLDTLGSQELPLDRPDTMINESDIIRVPLAAAIRFLVELENREAHAQPGIMTRPPFDWSLGPRLPQGYEGNKRVRCDPDTWSEAVMEAAERLRVEEVLDASHSVTRVRQILGGDKYVESEHWPFSETFTY